MGSIMVPWLVCCISGSSIWWIVCYHTEAPGLYLWMLQVSMQHFIMSALFLLLPPWKWMAVPFQAKNASRHHLVFGANPAWLWLILSFLYRASFQHLEWKPTDVTILLHLYCWISTCFGPTGPSSGEFVQLFTRPLVQYLCRSVRVLCVLWPVLVTILYWLPYIAGSLHVSGP